MKTRIKGLLACLAAGTLVGCASGGGSGGSGHGQVAPPPAPSQSSRSSAQSDSESLRNDQRPAGPMRPHAACRDRCGDGSDHGRLDAPCRNLRGARPVSTAWAPRRPAGSSVSAPAEPPHGYVRGHVLRAQHGRHDPARAVRFGAMERGAGRADRMARGAAGGGSGKRSTRSPSGRATQVSIRRLSTSTCATSRSARGTTTPAASTVT